MSEKSNPLPVVLAWNGEHSSTTQEYVEHEAPPPMYELESTSEAAPESSTRAESDGNKSHEDHKGDRKGEDLVASSPGASSSYKPPQLDVDSQKSRETQDDKGTPMGSPPAFNSYSPGFFPPPQQPTSRNPIDPPPPQFSRSAPTNYPYTMFPPIMSSSFSCNLEDGWPMFAPPPPFGMQHPFMDHDITEQDWTRFLIDLKSVGQFGQNKRKGELEGDLVTTWNDYFFHPRRMSVALCQGDRRHSGNGKELPPDMVRDGRGRQDLSSTRSRSVSPSPERRGMMARRRTRRRNGGGLFHGGGLIGGVIHTVISAGVSRNDSRSGGESSRSGGGGGGGGLISGVIGVATGGKEKQRKEDQSTERWRLVVCAWDGVREVV